MDSPQFILIAGPNGAGKSTSSMALVPSGVPYINADEIAKTLSAEYKDVQASRMLLEQWGRHETNREDFAIETTLASRSLAPKIKRLQEAGYTFSLYFFWLPNVDIAIQRVAERVRNGGHNIPEDVIRRRYQSGWRNFLDIYQPIANYWEVYSNMIPGQSALVAQGQNLDVAMVLKADLWNEILGRPIVEHKIVKEAGAIYSPRLREHDQAVQKAITAAVLAHKHAGNPIAIWRDGKVVIVQPEDIVFPEEENES